MVRVQEQHGGFGWYVRVSDPVYADEVSATIRDAEIRCEDPC